MIGGKIDAADTSQGEHVVFVESGTATVPDAATMFRGEYVKDGQDLTISYGDGPSIRIVDYFTTGFPPDLLAPNGAHLPGDTVVKLAGAVDTRLAQAGGVAQELADAIGQVESIEGTVTVTRADGSVVTLGDGDLVFQNDVVATASNSTVSLTFVDGTIFSLSAGSRMVLDELIYSPDGAGNSAVFNLIQGGFVFIAGEVAPTGDMRIGTPTGVLGIRGTTVEVQILAQDGVIEVLVALLVDPDGGVGQVEIRGLDGELIAIVTETDTTWVVSTVDGETREIPRADSQANDIGLLQQAVAAFRTANARVESGDTYVSQERTQSDGQPDEDDDADDADEADGAPQNQDPEGGGGGGGDPEGDAQPDVSQAPEANTQEGEGVEAPQSDAPAQDGVAPPPDGTAPETQPTPGEDSGALETPAQDNQIAQAAEGAAEGDNAANAAPAPETAGGDLAAGEAAGALDTVQLDQSGTIRTVQQDGNVPDQDRVETIQLNADGSIDAGTIESVPPSAAPVASEPSPEGAAFAQTPSLAFGDTQEFDSGFDSSLNFGSDIGSLGSFEQVSSADDGSDFGGLSSSPAPEPVAVQTTGTEEQTTPPPVTSPPQSDEPNTPQDLPPEAPGGQVTFFADQSNRSGILPASDPEGTVLTFEVIDEPTNGAVAIDPATGAFEYTADPGFIGTDSFSYQVRDSLGNNSGAATITVDYFETNLDPVAGDDTENVAEDGSVIVNLLSNDSDPENGILTVQSIGTAANGTAELQANGTVLYTPNANFDGTDNFTYVLSDDAGGTTTGMVTVTVLPINDAPTAVDDEGSTDEDVSVNLDVLSNDNDPEGGALTILNLGTPANGTVVLESDGTLTYTPENDYFGTDSFTYVAEDPVGAQTVGTVVVTILPINDAPDAVQDNVETPEDTSITINVLANDTDPENQNLTVESVGTASNGLVVLEADGQITYTPNTEYSGTDSFTYVVRDAEGASSIGTVSVLVNIENDPPVAVIDTASTAEDTAVGVNVLGNDTDPENNALLVQSVSDPANGTAQIQQDGTVLYTPDADFFGDDSFTYVIADEFGETSSNTVNISVTAVNDDPEPTNDPVETLEDTAINVDVLANDTDIDSTGLLVEAVGTPSNGSAVIEADGTITYTPNADYSGSDSFSYLVVDADGGSATGVVNVTVNPENDLPDVVDDTGLTLLEDTSLNIDVLANDSDPEGDTLTITALGDPSNGTAILEADGSITFTPTADFFGTDSFTYSATDSQGGTSQATVFVTVTPVNDAPIAVADGTQTDENVAVNIDVLANDTDIDDAVLTIQSFGQGANGSVALQQDNTFVYTPDTGFFGNDSFTYTVRDSGGETSTATVNISVGLVNEAPMTVNDELDTLEDTSANIDVLANDTDPDGDALTVVSIGTATNGTAVLEANGTVTYTPNENYFGPDSFTYIANDGFGGETTGTVNVTVVSVNDLPTADDDAGTTVEDTAINIDVLSNDGDLESAILTVQSVGPAANGTTVLEQDGTITYTPNADFVGSDSFTYVVIDDDGGTATATVVLTVDPVNDAPQASGDSATTAEDTPVIIAVLDNDTDPDGDTLSIVQISGAFNGTASIQSDGTIIFTPNADFNGAGQFDYTISDGNGQTDTATVNFNVTPVNDAPDASDDSTSTVEVAPVNIDVLANDGDVDGDQLSLLSVENGANGTTQIEADGTVTYTANAGFTGEDTFNYTVQDPGGLTSSAQVTIQVSDIANSAPVAENDTATVDEDSTIFISVLENDLEPDDDPITIDSVGTPANGTATITTGGRIIYAPDDNFNGTDSFTYVVTDGLGGFDTGTVEVTITPQPDTPIANEDFVETNEDTTINIDAVANDTDVDGETVSLQAVSIASNGTVTLAGDGTINYTPDANFSGQDSFFYTIADTAGFAAIGTVNVTVVGENDAPEAINDPSDTLEDTAVIINVLDNDMDADNDVLTVQSIGAAANGSAVLQLDGTVLYTPDADFSGTDGFSYVVQDPDGLTSTGNVTVTISPVADPVTINVVSDDDILDVQDQVNPVTISGIAEADGTVRVSFGAEEQTVASGSDGSYQAVFSPDVIPDSNSVLVSVEATDAFGNTGDTATRVVSIDQPGNVATINVAGGVSNFDSPLFPIDLNVGGMPYDAIFDEIDGNTFVERSPTTNNATEIRWTADDGRTFAFTGSDLNFDAGTGVVTGLEIGSPTDPDFYAVSGITKPLSEIKQIISDTLVGSSIDEGPFNAFFGEYSFVFNGSEGNDQIGFENFGQLGNTYFGNGGNDIFEGGLGDDQYFGGEGDDFFEDSQGSNSFDGGNGDFDFVSYALADGPVTVDLNAGTTSKTDGSSDTLVNINGIWGSAFGDTITMDGSAEVNIAQGLGGNDSLTGGAASFDYVSYDRDSRFTTNTTGVVVNLALGLATDLFGDTDTLAGFEGIIGSEFGDTLTASDTGTVFLGLAGDDRLISGAGDDNFSLAEGSETVVFTAGVDFVQNFDAANDALEFQGDALTFFNSLQLIDASVPEFQTVIFEFEDDQANLFSLTVSDLTIAEAEQIIDDLGLGGGEVIVDPTDTLVEGTLGDDTFTISGGGTNLLRRFVATTGDDVYDFTNATFTNFNLIGYGELTSGPITANIDLNAPNSTISKPNGQIDTLVNLPTAADWGFGLDGSTGNDIINVVYNPNESQFISFFGSGGDDQIDLTGGGTGTFALFARFNGAVTADLGAGTVSTADGQTYTITINPAGDFSQNRLQLNTGQDNDSVVGSEFRDQFMLGGGIDTVDGGNNTDVIRYDRSEFTSGVVVDLNAGTATGEWEGVAFSHSLTSIEEVRGTGLNDSILASDSDENFIDSGAGNDTIVGGQARTGMRLGDGNDSVIYSNGNDFINDFNLLDDNFEVAGVALANIGSLRFQIDDVDIFGGGTATRLQFDIDDAAFFGINFDNVTIQEAYSILAPTFATFTSGVTVALSDGDGWVYGSPGDDDITLQGRNTGDFEAARASVGDDIYRFVSIVPNNYGEIDYLSLGDVGITADLNVDAAQSTITKGRQFFIGTDTLTGLLDATDNGFGIRGTLGDDVWNIVQSSVDNGFLAIYSEGGQDVVNITSGLGTLQINLSVRFDAAVDFDVTTGSAIDEDGNSWDINFVGGDRSLGRLEVVTGWGNDTVQGSSFDERFILRGGTDSVDGGGNGLDYDIINYDRRGLETGVTVNLSLATAVVTGLWDGVAFNHSLSDIEGVRGSRFDDVLTLGNASGDIQGNDGNDSLTTGAGDDNIRLGSGNDTLVFSAGFDFVEDFNVAEDTLQLAGAALANANSLNVYDDSFDGNQRVNFDFNDGGNDFRLRFKNITLEEGLQIVDALGITGGQAINVNSGDQNVTGTFGDDSIIKLAGVSNDFEDTKFFATAGNDIYDFSSNRSNEYNFMDYGVLGDVGLVANLNFDGPDSTVQKGTFGTDTLIGLQASSDAGYEIRGTDGNDVFNATLNSTGFTQLELGFNGGQDAATIAVAGDGRVVLKTTFDQVDVFADLSSVTVDGTGLITTSAGDRTDLTFTGDFTGFGLRVETRNGDDSVLGSELNDRFFLRAGMDTVDGGGGFDTLRFDRNEYTTAISITLGSGLVSGMYDGLAYTHNFTSIEGVRGTDQGDTLIAGDFDSDLEGRGGNDSIVTGIGNDYVRLGGGNDTVVFSGGGFDSVDDFDTSQDSLQITSAVEDRFGSLRLFEFNDQTGVSFNFRNPDDSEFRIEFGGGFTLADAYLVIDSLNIAGVVVDSESPGEDVFGSPGDDTITIFNGSEFKRVNASAGDDNIFLQNFSNPEFISLDYRTIGGVGISGTFDFSDQTSSTVTKGTLLGSAIGVDTISNLSFALDEGIEIVTTRGDDTLTIIGDPNNPNRGFISIGNEGGIDTLIVTPARDTLQLDFFDGGDVFADLIANNITNSNGVGYDVTFTSDPALADLRYDVRTNSGDDIVFGTDNANRFTLEAGNDFADGRGGTDTIRYSSSNYTSAVTVDLRPLAPGDPTTVFVTGTYRNEAFTHELINIESVDGSRFDDVIYASDVYGEVRGRDGNDTIETGSGDIAGDRGSYYIEGGNGNDSIIAGTGINDVNLGSGNDTLVYTGGGDFVGDFIVGEDTFQLGGMALTNYNTISYFDATAEQGNTAADINFNAPTGFFGIRLDGLTVSQAQQLIADQNILPGTVFVDDDTTVFGTAGDDTFAKTGEGAFSVTSFEGSAGNDIYDMTRETFTNYNEYRYFGSGADFITADFVVSREFNTITKAGGLGTDTLLGTSAAADWGFGIEGTSGDDVISINRDIDMPSFFSFNGNGGQDTINVSGTRGRIQIGPTYDAVDVVADLSTLLITSTTYFAVGDQSGSDPIGTTLNVSGDISSTRFQIQTGSGNDSIQGSSLGENFITRGGEDTVDGGGGYDELRFAEGFVNLQLGNEIAEVVIGATTFNQVVRNIEGARGTELADTLSGTTDDNYFDARGGNDLLIGGGGEDTLSGGADNDQIFWDFQTSSTALGDSGYDDIFLVDSGSFDLSGVALASNVSGFERINMENGSGTDNLTLSAQNVLDLTTRADSLLDTIFGNALSIIGEVGDEVDLTSGGNYTLVGNDTDSDGRNMNVYEYSEGAGVLAIVAVDEDVAVNQVA